MNDNMKPSLFDAVLFIHRLHSFLSLHAVVLRAVGGEVGATSSLAPKIGPLGLVSSHSCLLLWFCFSQEKMKESSACEQDKLQRLSQYSLTVCDFKSVNICCVITQEN
jgi:hypothetical protein